tara:strand:- start:122 stop:379 length:258 start_codon:yes stop_codon:yes gene_type:complete
LLTLCSLIVDMKYSVSDIDKIVNFKTWSDKQKIDELLRIDTMIYPNLGIESSVKEKRQAQSISKQIYRSIKKIDKTLGETLLVNY